MIRTRQLNNSIIQDDIRWPRQLFENSQTQWDVASNALYDFTSLSIGVAAPALSTMHLFSPQL
jgi:hypothetical protein